MKTKYHVYAIAYKTHNCMSGWSEIKTVAVSAESEYGAIKRFAGNSCAMIKDIELIKGRLPEWEQRRIEGSVEFDWKSCREDDGEGGPHLNWEYR